MTSLEIVPAEREPMVAAEHDTIVLVTDSGVTRDLVTLMFKSLTLVAGPAQRHAVARFGDLPLVERSNGAAALELLGHRELPDGSTPALIILDASVRQRDDPMPGNGSAATALLQWLAEHRPSVPVIVASKASHERLDLKILERPNVVRWSIDPKEADSPIDRFVALLVGFGGGPPASPCPRRVTVVVGRDSARYRIKEGTSDPIGDDQPYAPAARMRLRGLMDVAKNFTPYDATNQPRCGWQDELSLYGNNLYELLRNTLGDGLFKELGPLGEPRAPRSARGALDVRFDIDMDSAITGMDGLFSLPFEALNDTGSPESFLCTNVPMARRIGARLGDQDPVAQTSGAKASKVLFLDANVRPGSISVLNEVTGKPASYRLGRLAHVKDELKSLNDLAGDAAKLERRLEAPEVLDGATLQGYALKDRLETELMSGQYDVFHFAGHSISDADSTFLVLPGENNQALGMSIRDLADWVTQGGCKLVVLSACQAASQITALKLMRAGVEAVIGFRWNADDEFAGRYMERFYRAYFRHGKTLSAAYREACRAMQREAMGNPLWASAIAVVRD
jgi:hypothetical protein